MRIGIDASNLRQGGGRTHLTELLKAANPRRDGFDSVVVWGSQETLDLLPGQPWLNKIPVRALERGLLTRIIWQSIALGEEANRANCNLLFAPGGIFQTGFRPIVVMSRNMLPFEWNELKRFGASRKTVKLLLLRLRQTRSLRTADGVVFLTHYAEKKVQKITGALSGRVEVIPHGVSTHFFRKIGTQRPIHHYSSRQPMKLVYVSMVDQYKHQWAVVEAVAFLRNKYRWPLELELAGPAYGPALARLQKAIRKHDATHLWVRYTENVDFSRIPEVYARSDVGVFASSCENMPNILLEFMAAGLPLASSNRGPMPEILGEAGVFFDPESPSKIAEALKRLIDDPPLRTRLAAEAQAKAKGFSWENCAHQTFTFLTRMAAICRPSPRNQRKSSPSIRGELP